MLKVCLFLFVTCCQMIVIQLVCSTFSIDTFVTTCLNSCLKATCMFVCSDCVTSLHHFPNLIVTERGVCLFY